MSSTEALIWFVAMTLAITTIMVVGTYLAMHTYTRGRGAVHFHVPVHLPRRRHIH